MSNDLYTVEALADRWGTSARTIERMLQSKQIRGFKVGSSWRILVSEIEKYEKGESIA